MRVSTAYADQESIILLTFTVEARAAMGCDIPPSEKSWGFLVRALA